MQFLHVTPRLPVASLSRTIAFYTGLLGFRLGLLWPDEAPTFVILDRDEMSLQFYLPETPGPVGQGTLNLDVSDVRVLHQMLDGQVRVEWGPEVY
jgi:catechol 2,3-dioxygenase-like lactoylglutathione lyase family enzyme